MEGRHREAQEEIETLREQLRTSNALALDAARALEEVQRGVEVSGRGEETGERGDEEEDILVVRRLYLPGVRGWAKAVDGAGARRRQRGLSRGRQRRGEKRGQRERRPIGTREQRGRAGRRSSKRVRGRQLPGTWQRRWGPS